MIKWNKSLENLVLLFERILLLLNFFLFMNFLFILDLFKIEFSAFLINLYFGCNFLLLLSFIFVISLELHFRPKECLDN